jgi:hypothetical protein
VKDGEEADPNRLRLVSFAPRICSYVAGHFQYRDRFVGTQGLGQVVVGTGDAVVLLHTGGEHYGRSGLAAGGLLQKAEAVEDGEHDVKDDEIVGPVECRSGPSRPLKAHSNWCPAWVKNSRIIP